MKGFMSRLTVKNNGIKYFPMKAGESYIFIYAGSFAEKRGDTEVVNAKLIALFDAEASYTTQDGTEKNVIVKAGDIVKVAGSKFKYMIEDGLQPNTILMVDYIGAMNFAQYKKYLEKHAPHITLTKPNNPAVLQHRMRIVEIEDTDSNIEILTEETGYNPRDFFLDDVSNANGGETLARTLSVKAELYDDVEEAVSSPVEEEEEEAPKPTPKRKPRAETTKPKATLADEIDIDDMFS